MVQQAKHRLFDRPEIYSYAAIQEQVRTHVRRLVVSGQLAPREQLPSIRELAQQWKTSPQTIHLALTALEREGLLAHVHGVGTFVCQREKKLTCVGVLLCAENWGKDGSLYTQSLHAALREEFARREIEMSVWIDPRPAGAHGERWTPLTQAAAERKFQALIAVAADIPLLGWLTRLPVPVALQSSLNTAGCVNFDLGQFASCSLRELAGQGCRSVGLIAPFAPNPRPGTARRQYDDFYDAFIEVSRELGLAVKNEWVRLPGAHADLDTATLIGRSQEAFGYEQFRELWCQPARPDGLVVFPDTTARGVILGVREQHADVPGTLKLVLHKNEGIDLLCPLSATLMVGSERQLARALIAQAEKQFRGEPCPPVHVPFRAVAHPAVEPTRRGAHRGDRQTEINQ